MTARGKIRKTAFYVHYYSFFPHSTPSHIVDSEERERQQAHGGSKVTTIYWKAAKVAKKVT